MLYLTEQERELIESLIEPVSNHSWVAGSIMKKLIAETERQKAGNSCEHKVGYYFGAKKCCVKCGSFYEKGMREEWELVEPIKKEYITSLVEASL